VDGNWYELVLVADGSEVLEILLIRRLTPGRELDPDTFEAASPGWKHAGSAIMKGGADHGKPRGPNLDHHEGADADRQVRDAKLGAILRLIAFEASKDPTV